MGIIDSTWFKYSCGQCGAQESIVIHDKGSGWSGSSWQSIPAAKDFLTVTTGGGKTEPEVTAATCKKCGTAAKIDTGYGTRPR